MRNTVLLSPQPPWYIRLMDAELHDFVRIPTWPAGLKMLEKYSKDIPGTTRSMAGAYQNSLTLDMLVAACKIIANKQPKPPTPQPRVILNKAKNEQARVSYALPDDAKLPADLIELKNDVVAWLAEQRDIRGRLRQLAYDGKEHGKELYSLSAKVISRETLLQDAYARLDYYDRMGEYLPNTAPVPKADRLVHLLQSRQNHKDYIRRYGNSDKERQQKEVLRRKNELAELKNLLNEKEGK